MSNPLNRELVFLILQFLDEEKFKETVHRLEKESGFFFNMKYFEEAVLNGEWTEVDEYLSGFTKVDANRISSKIFFEIRKQRYLEALEKRDDKNAVEFLRNDLKFISSFNDDLYKELALLLTLTDFRENPQLANYIDAKQARPMVLAEVKKLIEANPLFRDKLQFPSFNNGRFRTLLNQSLNWQHQLCRNPEPNPDITTLLVDHACGPPSSASASTSVTNPPTGSMPKVGGLWPVGASAQFQPTSIPVPPTTSVGGWNMTDPSSMPAMCGGPMNLSAPKNAPDVTYGHGQTSSSYSYNDLLPKTVVVTLNHGSAPDSSVKSLDFHPLHQTLLLVGTSVGDVILWNLGNRNVLAFRNFKIWDIEACSTRLQASLANDYSVSVNRVMWSPDGSLLGVAFSKHLVHLFSFNSSNGLRNHIEIDAHVGNVNDLGFCRPDKCLCIITCGDDMAIKVWDTISGSRRYTFEGHQAPVYSICAHQKEGIEFIYSTSVDGKIKAWLYNDLGSRANYDAPGQSCTTMAYSTDGTRLFSCGTSRDGESHMVEWSETGGSAVKRSYLGLGKRSVGVVKFDTAKNQFLVAGDQSVIKFWDMDDVNLLTTIDADGGLPASPCVRFSKDGIFLAVSASENDVKVLANAEGLRLVQSNENRALKASWVVSGSIAKSPIVGPSSSPAGTNVGVAGRGAPVTTIFPANGDRWML